MSTSDTVSRPSPGLRYYFWIHGAAWTVLVLLSLGWNLHENRKATVESVRTVARAAFQKDVLYRRWNAGIGRIYAPVSDKVRPNPHLHVNHRDVTTTDGRRLTMINPAYMTRLVYEISDELYNLQGHITSVNPIRPENAPDSWERRALEKLAHGQDEVSQVAIVAGEPVLRLMRPLVTEKACLACHADQGYKEGDIRGGISVRVPFSPVQAAQQQGVWAMALGHALLWTLGMCGLWYSNYRLQNSFREREAARRAAEEASRVKSEFLANMSHEIRTPMNGIIGMTELALNSHIPPQPREYLTSVLSSAESLMTLMNDMLDFSKIEAGKLTVESVSFSLRDLMADTLRVVAVQTERKGVRLSCDIAPGIPDLLRGDPVRLRQILLNLLGNAVKFTNEGGITVTVVPQEYSPQQVLLLFTVTDTGIGIPTDKKELIFQEFTQVDGSTTRRFGGTGLGLSICARLVNMMGGEIQVQSELGQGSTFSFTITLGEGDLEQEAAGGWPATWRRDKSILVVDDDGTNRQILESLLRHWDMRPMVASNGPEALSVMKEAAKRNDPIPLIISDMYMPDMDGSRLLERISEELGDQAPKSILLTSDGPPQSTTGTSGPTVLLTKPVRQRELAAALTQIMNGTLTVSSPPHPSASPTSPGHSRLTGLRVLVAEDNEVNQQLTTHVLQGLGHVVTIVGDGQQAVNALEDNTFDLILMDVQMPGKDGLAATREIRGLEQSSGTHVPIIAMTAYAMKGDREKCLAAGMDAYLAKPVRQPELVSAIQAVVTNPSQGEPSARQDADPLAMALAQLEGNRDLLTRLAEVFRNQYPSLLSEIEATLADRDAAALGRAIHTLKGSLGVFGRGTAFESAAALENLVATGDLDRFHSDLSHLRSEVERLMNCLPRTGPDTGENERNDELTGF
jgi:signal transduction histidine kinase/CheY-like chemotaxis protein